MKRILSAALVLPCLTVASMALAQNASAPNAEVWQRNEPSDQSYSIETPCGDKTVKRQSVDPMIVADRPVDAGSGVACVIGDMVFSSGVMSVAESEIGDVIMFDYVLEQLASEGVPDAVQITQTNVAGQRALLSREVRESEIAQAGIVELSNRSLLLLVSGGETADNSKMAKLIDRHVASLKVAQK